MKFLGVSDTLTGDLLGKKLSEIMEDANNSGDLRRDCAFAVGQLGLKDKAVEILTNMYLSQTDKSSADARQIYRSIWKLTAI